MANNRKRVLIHSCIAGAAVLFIGCGGEDTPPTPNPPASSQTDDSGAAPEPGTDEESPRPTVLGVDNALQKELRVLLSEYIAQVNPPGDPEDNLNKAFDIAMNRLRRPAQEFGFEADAEGNLVWPEEIQREMLAPIRTEFDDGTLFESREIDLPDWAQPLLKEYQANTISPQRRELLFHIASGIAVMNMT